VSVVESVNTGAINKADADKKEDVTPVVSTPYTPVVTQPTVPVSTPPVAQVVDKIPEIDIPFIDREAVVRAINNAGLLTYHVRRVAISDYIKSMYALAHFLTQSRIDWDCLDAIKDDIVKMHYEDYNSMHDKVGIVEYFNGAFGISYKQGRHFLAFNEMSIYCRWVEVIGNKFDNPELLEEINK
jgi:hypothetical protein